MPTPTKPTVYLDWTDGSPTKVTQPGPSQQASGWVAGERPPFQYMNWLFYITDQWIQWLDYYTGTIIDNASGIIASNTNHRIATGTDVQAQLDQIDNALWAYLAITPNTMSPRTMSNTQLTGDNSRVFLVQTSLGAMTFNLPAPLANFKFKIKDVDGSCDTNNITLVRNGSEKIENVAASYIMQAPYGEWNVYSDGTNWYLV